MTDEYDFVGGSEPLGPLPTNEPQTPADAEPEQDTSESGGSAFAQTVFGAAESSTPAPEAPNRTAPASDAAYAPQPENSAPEAPAQETVHAERVPEYTQEPTGGYYGYQNIPPYGSAQSGGYGAQTGAYNNRNPYSTGSGAYGAPQQSSYSGYTQSSPNPYYGAPTGGSVPAQPPKKEKKGMKIFFRVLVAAIIVGLVFAVVRLAIDRTPASEPQSTKETVTAAANAPEMETKASPASNNTASGGAMTPTQIAAKVRSVSVGILVYSGNSTSVSSEGSGVLWKEDNSKTYTYIITCAHVISGSGLSYTVQTEDGATYDAELVGADAKTDLGVLRIKTTGLSLAEFGDSAALQVGDPVYAIGNPGGTEFFGSFTSGIVSAIDRSVKSTYTMVCIQHTAAINPGNSGGALVNQYGQVVGINSQKIVNTEYEGMGFAIPIKSAQSIVNALASYGYVKDRPRLGITYSEAINYQQYSMIIKIRGLPSGSLIIQEISSDSSLANTEAKTGDMIIKVDGQDMTTPNVLLDKIENGKVGDKLRLTLCRIDNNYQTTNFDVTVTLVEETRDSEKTETTTTQSYFNPYDFFNGDFGSFFGN